MMIAITSGGIIGGIVLGVLTVGGAYVLLRLGYMGLGWAYRQIFGNEGSSEAPDEAIDGRFEVDYHKPDSDEKIMRRRGEK